MKSHVGSNVECFTCGGAKPVDVYNRHESEWAYDYRCPECHRTIVQGLQYTDGNVVPDGTAPHRPPPWIQEEAIRIYNDVEWQTWEVWWSPTGSFVSAINGRTTYGNPALLEEVEFIQSTL